MRFDLLTLHPAMCTGPLAHSILGRASAAGLIDVAVHDLRDWAEGKHRTADDTPYGGGSGMVMRVDVIDRGIEAVRQADSHVILMDPAGTPFTQAVAERLSAHRHLILVCGHYEGVDGRVRDHLVDEAISVGDYILTGGELPALVVVDAVARLIPGVLGNPDSPVHESFSTDRLEAPQFTRPRSYRDWAVPEVLLSGHHERIAEWRAAQSETLTRRVRPDLVTGSRDEES
jgi:tRNA (guanine37-N1)-methyltransferase